MVPFFVCAKTHKIAKLCAPNLCCGKVVEIVENWGEPLV